MNLGISDEENLADVVIVTQVQYSKSGTRHIYRGEKKSVLDFCITWSEDVKRPLRLLLSVTVQKSLSEYRVTKYNL